MSRLPVECKSNACEGLVACSDCTEMVVGPMKSPHITAYSALIATALSFGGCSSPPIATPVSARQVDGGSHETASNKAAGLARTFALGNTKWTVELPGAAVTPRGSVAVMLADDGRTFWITRYEEGAGPIDLRNALSIIVDDPEPTVLFEQGRTDNVAFELVVQGPDGLRGERLIDDPDGTGATIDCSFELAENGEPAWRLALDVCRSLTPDSSVPHEP